MTITRNCHTNKDQGKVAIISFWRNDGSRRLLDRAEHLTRKTYKNKRYIWVVGDCWPGDTTFEQLERFADESKEDITVVYNDFLGSVDPQFNPAEYGKHDPAQHLVRLAVLTATFNYALDYVEPADEFVMLHESDLLTSSDVIQQLLSFGKVPIGGWPVVELDDHWYFYDTWGYRKNGVEFMSGYPYHTQIEQNSKVIEVDSVGSCWIWHASDILSGVRIRNNMATVGLCEELKKRGRRIWVAKDVVVIQPNDLYTPWLTPAQREQRGNRWPDVKTFVSNTETHFVS